MHREHATICPLQSAPKKPTSHKVSKRLDQYADSVNTDLSFEESKSSVTFLFLKKSSNTACKKFKLAFENDASLNFSLNSGSYDIFL